MRPIRDLSPLQVWCGLLGVTGLSLLVAMSMRAGLVVIGLLTVMKAALIVHGFMHLPRNSPYLGRILIGYAWVIAILATVRMGVRIG